MHHAVLEFVMSAHMVEMAVTGYAQHLAFGQQADVAAQGHDAETRIEQQVALAAAYMPHVAAHAGVDERFPDQRDAVGQALAAVPILGATDGKAHGAILAAMGQPRARRPAM